MEYPIAPGPPLGGPGLAAPARAQIIPFGCGSNGQINDHAAAQNGGYLRTGHSPGPITNGEWDGRTMEYRAPARFGLAGRAR